MPQKPRPSTDAATLRSRAETKWRKQEGRQKSVPVGPSSEADTQRLLHELQVHQIELEMQNEELRAAREEAEVALEKYTDLYEFAPVGYFSIDEHGFIQEVNLRGTVLLQVARARLVGRSIKGFVAAPSQAVFRHFLEMVFAGSDKLSCEVSLQKGDDSTFWADIQAAPALGQKNRLRWCRVVVMDITALKQGEEAQHRAQILAAANRKMQREIVRRQAVEKALKTSKQQQGQMLVQSRRMQKQLRHLSFKILLAQEEERKRISRELHDEIAQTLVGINVLLGDMTRELETNPKGLKRKILRMQRLLEESMINVHQFARDLRPAMLDDLGLIPTLHAYIKDFEKRTGVTTHFQVSTVSRFKELDGNKRTVLYRVTQEALTNIAHHAHASRVEVSITKHARDISLTIRDDGKSFPVHQVLQARGSRHLGLIGMRERVEMVGGKFCIASAPGEGTTVRAQIPLAYGRKRVSP